MKKLLASISVMTYLVMTCGVVINLHYCMGRVQSIDFYGMDKKNFHKCGMPAGKKNNCCKEEVKILKLQDDQNKAFVSHSVRGIEVPAIVPSGFIAAVFNNNVSSLHYNNHSPPLLTAQDTYLRNCVFRI